uniref:FLYWCH-type domain-containing protein n=1 Tax=Globodera rostochiensis TaxID=31243 RepID=A0A914GVI9_GLORO
MGGTSFKECLQKNKKQYIAAEQNSPIASVGDENLEPVEFELGKTIRGKECAWYKGFRYLHNAAHSLSWRCSDRKCKGTLRILERRDDKAFGHVGQHEHNHLPDPARKEADSKKQALKRKIQEEPNAKPSKIFAQQRKDVNCEVFVEMGTDIALRQMLRREKAKVFGNVNSANPLTIKLSDALIIKDGESMLLYDSRISRPNQGDVVLVFAIPKLLDVLSKEKSWHIDGTFKCTPAQWKQCLVIGASVRKRMVLCVHALLPGKHRKYYEEVFQVIKQVVLPSFPYTVLSRFGSGTPTSEETEMMILAVGRGGKDGKGPFREAFGVELTFRHGFDGKGRYGPCREEDENDEGGHRKSQGADRDAGYQQGRPEGLLRRWGVVVEGKFEGENVAHFPEREGCEFARRATIWGRTRIKFFAGGGGGSEMPLCWGGGQEFVHENKGRGVVTVDRRGGPVFGGEPAEGQREREGGLIGHEIERHVPG